MQVVYMHARTLLGTEGYDLLARKNTSAEIKCTASQRDWALLGLIDRSRPLGPQIYETMRLAIILKMFRANDSINEMELSQALNVSRTPLREAYQRLAEDGLIESRPKSSAIVTAIDAIKVRTDHADREFAAADQCGIQRTHYFDQRDKGWRHRAVQSNGIEAY